MALESGSQSKIRRKSYPRGAGRAGERQTSGRRDSPSSEPLRGPHTWPRRPAEPGRAFISLTAHAPPGLNSPRTGLLGKVRGAGGWGGGGSSTWEVPVGSVGPLTQPRDGGSDVQPLALSSSCSQGLREAQADRTRQRHDTWQDANGPQEGSPGPAVHVFPLAWPEHASEVTGCDSARWPF